MEAATIFRMIVGCTLGLGLGLDLDLGGEEEQAVILTLLIGPY